jgi:hypothetical protein
VHPASGGDPSNADIFFPGRPQARLGHPRRLRTAPPPDSRSPRGGRPARGKTAGKSRRSPAARAAQAAAAATAVAVTPHRPVLRRIPVRCRQHAAACRLGRHQDPGRFGRLLGENEKVTKT